MDTPSSGGTFWFDGWCDGKPYRDKVTVISDDSLGRGPRVFYPDMGYWDDSDSITIWVGQWWGPIPELVPPWDEQ
jgi:hypothetical protein